MRHLYALAHYCLDLAELLDLTRIIPVAVFLRPGKVAQTLHVGSERRTRA